MGKKELGQQRMKEILGVKAPDIIANLEKISPDFANYIVEFAYGDLYMRTGLSDKYRELAAVSCMIGQGTLGPPFRSHMHAMLNVGWKKEEVIEFIISLIGFAGFPACVNAINVFGEVVSE